MEILRILDPKNIARLLLAICAVFLVLGCQTISFDPRGHFVPEDKRITIPDLGEQSGLFQTEDLMLTYKMVKTPGRLTISGEIDFSEGFTKSFPVFRYFHLDAVLLDAQGKVQRFASLTGVSFYHTKFSTLSDYPISFSMPIILADSTRSLAFSYTGQAISEGDAEDGFLNFCEYPIY